MVLLNIEFWKFALVKLIPGIWRSDKFALDKFTPHAGRPLKSTLLTVFESEVKSCPDKFTYGPIIIPIDPSTGMNV